MALAPIHERRSLGLKFLLVCFLVLLLTAPTVVVSGIVRERVGSADAVVQEVGQIFGGRQSFLGPILVAPYRAVTKGVSPEGVQIDQVQTGWYVVFAETGAGRAAIDVDTRTRGEGGLFKVRTYEANVQFDAKFDLTDQPSAAPEGATIDWSRAALLIGVGDTRGARKAEIAIAGAPLAPLQPGSAYANVLSLAVASMAPNMMENPTMQWLAAPVGALAKPGAAFDVSAQLAFSGVESVALGPFAKETQLNIEGDWGDVGYFGAFPADHGGAGAVPEGQADRFAAQWAVPYVARGLADAGPATEFNGLGNLFVETRLLDPSNPYKAVERSLKYALMFVGVVFLAYFLMEATSDRRVHPAQYLLVGLAQVIFYLLLLSIAERIGFDLAFVIAASATVLLIGTYAGAAFRSLVRGLGAIAAFGALYALIYLLMRAEDYALLAGSIAAFVAIAAVMFFTRNVDWYGLTPGLPPGPAAFQRQPQAPAPRQE